MNGQAGKGSQYRKVDRKKYEEGWDRIFGDKKNVEETETENDYGQVEPFKSSDPISRSIEAHHRR